MKTIILAMALISIFSSDIYASEYKILEDNLFGIEKDTLIELEIESMMLNKIDSLKKHETNEAFKKFPIVAERYSFKDLPCLKLYYLFDERAFLEIARDPYLLVIYNIFDSTIYPFSGSEGRFNDIIERYLGKIMKEDRILDLLKFYLNTLSADSHYYIVKSIQDYQKLWKESDFRSIGPATSAYLDTLSIIDIEQVRDHIVPLNINIIEESGCKYHECELTSWDFDFGAIIVWRFRISSSQFKVVSKSINIQRVGPWTGLW